MKLIRNKKWIKGKSYQKRILLDGLKRKINIIEDVIVEPGGIIPAHKHNFTDEIFYITENTAVVIVDGKKHEVHPGDMIYIGRNEEHGFKNESDSEFKMIVFKLNFKKGDSYLK